MDRFLKSCKCTLENEVSDYQYVVNEILSKPAYISLMPSVIADLWPLYVLECTSAQKLMTRVEHNHVCFIPIGTHDFWALPSFVNLIERFYRNEELGLYAPLTYGAEIEEVILLKSESLPKATTIAGLGLINTVYIRIYFPASPSIHLFVILETAEGAWKNIFTQYSLECDMLIDSHRGLGDYLKATKLYEMFIKNKLDPLLPKFYFKGKSIKAAPPEGFILRYTVPESKKGECTSQIYTAKWG